MASKWLKERWVAEMIQSLRLTHPEASEESIRKFVEKQYEKHFTEHEAKIYNSYENITYETTLGETVDWFQSFKPLIAESGVFFYPKNVKRNLNIEIIKEEMLDARTIHKKEKFKALDAGDMFMAAVKDSQQLNDKKAANSGYGAEGQRSSFLFNMHSAMSVTACGRGQLSTACQCIENLLADNVKFFNMDEYFHYLKTIMDEQPEWVHKTYDVIDNPVSKKRFVDRMCSKFLHISLADVDMIEKSCESLDDEMRTRIFYKSNIYDFFRDNIMPGYIFKKIVEKPDEFPDPNDVPKSMKEDLDLLVNICMEFVGYRYGIFRYEDRTRYQKRAVVPVMDKRKSVSM